MSEDRQKALRLLHEGQRRGVSIKAIAALIGICSRTLRRWGIAFKAQGFTQDCRKGSTRHVVQRFGEDERKRVIAIINDARFADLTPNQIVAILDEE